MKNIEIETDEWRDDLRRAFKRLQRIVPDGTALTLIVAEKHENTGMALSLHSTLCSHLTCDLLAITAHSTAATLDAEAREDGAHSKN